MLRHHRARRLGVLSTTAVLAVSTLLGSPAQAASSPSADRAETWLAGELVDGLLPGPFGGTDIGLSIDAALLAAATGDTATATAIRDAVEPGLVDYISDDNYGDPGSTYVNQAAKVLVMVQRTGGDPRSYGGIDLVARVVSLTAANGRVESVGTYATPANLIGQSFAVEGLRRAGAAPAQAAATYLAGLACLDGSFSLTMPKGDAAPACAPGDTSVDAAAFALSALSGAAGNTAAAAATARGAGWLASQAGADGSYGSDAFIPTPNANSTGLAAAALGDACQVAAANRSAAWVRSVQLAGPDAGAVAYDAPTAAAAQPVGAGEDDAARDQFRRSTAQAGLALVWDPTAPTALRLSAAGGVLTIDGATAGQTVCLTTPTGTTRLTGTGSPLTVPAATPTAGSATWTATAGPGLATLTITAPPTTAPTTPVTATPAPSKRAAVRFGGKRLERGERHTVKIRGLRADEKVVARLRDRKVAIVRADAAGTAKIRFRVTGRTGPARLVVLARGSDQKFRAVVRVVR